MWFKHNDMTDLEAKLVQAREAARKVGRKGDQQRRFIVVEGLYRNRGDICPLPSVIKLKKEFFCRVMLDESYSFGCFGKHSLFHAELFHVLFAPCASAGATGRGLCEHFSISLKDIDIHMVSMENALASVGGMCVGRREVVDHQRLSGAGYCFSASAPPFLSAAALVSLDKLRENPGLVAKLRSCTEAFVHAIKTRLHLQLELVSDPISPIIHIAVKRTEGEVKSEQQLVDELAEECLRNGLAIARARYVGEDLGLLTSGALRPTLRMCVNAGLTDAQVNDAIQTLETSCKNQE
jgi:serine palmitoyltransferase